MTARFGQRLFSTGEAIPASALRNVGLRALQAVGDGALAMLAGSPGASSITPSSAFIGGNSFRPVLSSGLNVSIKPGRAVYVRSELDSYTPSSDPHGIDVIPLLLNTATTVTHDAHDATHPRWDIISVKWTTADADSGSRYVRTAGPGSQAVSALNESRSWAPTFTITKGTPGASPSLPTAPADKMTIAHVYVPATSGDVTVYDVRLVQRLGFGWADGPIAPDFGQPFVASGCTATAPGGMVVTIAGGTVYDGVATRTTSAASVTVSAAHATLDRIDLVYLDGGRVTYLAGTAASAPTAPALPSGTYGLTQPLCEISVPATDTVISSGQIVDTRQLRPYVLADHVQYTPTVFARVTVAAQQGVMDPNPTYRRVTIQAVDQEGVEIPAVVHFRVSTWSSADGLEAVETVHGSAHAILDFDITPVGQQVDLGTGPTSAILATDEDGEVVFDISGVDGDDAYLKITPIDWSYASDDTAEDASEAAYKPGGETIRKISFR